MRGSKWLDRCVRFLNGTARRYSEIIHDSKLPKSWTYFVLTCGIVYVWAVLSLCVFDSFVGLPLLYWACCAVFSWWLISNVVRVGFCNCADDGLWMDGWRLFVCLVVILCMVAFTGSFTNPDTVWQWEQATGSSPFDDWHPIVHTGVIAILQRILRRYRLIVTFQAGVFAGLLTWLYLTLKKYRYGSKASLVVVLLLAFSPFSLQLISVLWKDTAFAFAALAISVLLIQLVEERGANLSLARAVSLALLIFLASFFRHNGIFYTVPLLVLLPFAVKRQYLVRTLSLVIVSFLMIGFYVCMARPALVRNGIIVVSKQGQSFVESVGLPMSIMAESYVLHPERTPKEVIAFLEQIGDRTVWEKNYRGEFNSVKFNVSGGAGRVLNEIGPKDFGVLFVKTVKANPVSSIKEFLYLTSCAWSPFPPRLQEVISFGSGVCASSVSAAGKLTLHSLIGYILCAPGFHLIVLVLALVCAILRRGWRVLVMAVPLICYQFGTMLLLTGFDYRFFFITILCSYPLSLALLKGE